MQNENNCLEVTNTKVLKVREISRETINPFFICRCSIRLCIITVRQVERKLFGIFKRTGKIKVVGNYFSPPQWEMTI